MTTTAPRYTHTATAVYDGQMWNPAIMRADHIAHTSVQRYEDKDSAIDHAKVWLKNLRRSGQCYP